MLIELFSALFATELVTELFVVKQVNCVAKGVENMSALAPLFFSPPSFRCPRPASCAGNWQLNYPIAETDLLRVRVDTSIVAQKGGDTAQSRA